MFDIKNLKTFKDSVHGYIDVPKCFVQTLMDNEYFQRLRNVEQTGMRVLYPNAKHDRFSHSLGVFHLGRRAVDALLENFSKDQYWKIESDNQSVLYWAKNKVLFLIACLLHDIGHAPFSHALESQILNNSYAPNQKEKKEKAYDKKENKCYVTRELERTIFEKEKEYMMLKYNEKIEENNLDVSNVAPHEQIGAFLIFDKFFRNQIIKIFKMLHNDSFPCPEGESILYSEYYQDKVVIDKIDEDDNDSMIVFWDDLCFIARMIMGLKYDDWRPERQIRNCFIELLNGENFDVDKLDYIVRDTQMSGINNISLDVDRLVNSIYIVTKTKHLNKIDIKKNNIKKLTIVSIKNSDKDKKINIDGNFRGTIIIKKGAEVAIESGSKIESFTSPEGTEAKIHYRDARKAKFASDAIVTQDSDLIPQIDSGKEDDEKVVVLSGERGNRRFGTSIKNALLLDGFYFYADEDIKLTIHETCKIKIVGAFNSDTSIKLFNINEMTGDVSEIEVLGDTFQYEFTKTKVPGKDGYNTFTIGFKKQAINVIANVMDARNYLYLWIYAHHKVIYYANFLVPALAKELFPKKSDDNFPNWSLDFNNIRYLDDAYVWTAMRFKQQTEQFRSIKQKEIKNLLEELFTRKYKNSLYKSLAEYDLFFEKYNQQTIDKLQGYINDHLIDGRKNAKPNISSKKKEKQVFSVGYFKNEEIVKINNILKNVIFQGAEYDDKCKSLQLTELIYVAADYKRKQFETANTFIDMKDDIVPISQIQLLESQIKKTKKNISNNYFYLYYKINFEIEGEEKTVNEIVKKAIKKLFEEIVNTKINKK